MPISEDDCLVCPHCIAPIGPFDHFCPHCGGPVTAHASNDPVGQIYSAGRAYRNATENPRLIVVIGMWLIFGPQLLTLLGGLFITLSNLIAPGHIYAWGNGNSLTPHGDGIALELIRLLVVIGLMAVYIAILWKVTSRYTRLRREQRLKEPPAAREPRGFPVIPDHDRKP